MATEANDDVAAHLSSNMKQLREARGLSQQQCSKIAGIPRPTWANLESGAANPTLAVLMRVAAALTVSVEELIRPPESACQLYRAGTLPRRTRSGCTLSQLLPDRIVGIQIERLELPSRGGLVGAPHSPGTREYLVCERGRIELSLAEEHWELSSGDVLAFRGDQKHSYRNPGTSVAVGYSVITLSPA